MNNSTSQQKAFQDDSDYRPGSMAVHSGLFATYLAHVDDSVFVLNELGSITYLSQSASRRFSQPPSTLVGQNFASLLRDFPPRVETQLPSSMNGEAFESWLRHSTETLLTSAAPMKTALCVRLENQHQSATMQGHGICSQLDGHVVCFITLRDVQQQLDREAQLSREATTDALTGLLNRRGFQTQLEQHLGRPVALAILDVDHFKQINDSRGHQLGDEILIEITACLTASFSDAALARLGGDEFGIVLAAATEPTAGVEASIEAVEDRFTTLLNTVRTNMSQRKTPATISVGVAIDLAGHRSSRDLLACADKAMYEAKADGRDRVRFARASSLEN